MFPSFESLSQRERKRQEILERAQRRVRQANEKRQMYSEAQWATDADKSISLTKSSKPSSEISIQTDESSNKNPEVSTGSSTATETETTPNVHPLMVDAEATVKPQTSDVETTAKPQTSDAETTAKPQTSDATATAKPQTATVGIDNSSRMSTIGVQSSPEMTDSETNTLKSSTAPLDREDQVLARIWIKQFYTRNPNWAALTIHPIKRKDGKDDKRYVLREKGSMVNVKTKRKSKNYQAIDWEATKEKIRGIMYDGESNSIDESQTMYGEDKPVQSDRKRKSEDDIEDLDTPFKDPRLDLKYLDKSTSTDLDDDYAKYKLTWFIINNSGMLEAKGLHRKIHPMLKNGKTYIDGYIWKDHLYRVYVFGVNTDKHRPAVQKEVDWMATLDRFIHLAQENNLNLVTSTAMDKTISPSPYNATIDMEESVEGVKTGKDEDMDKTIPLPDLDAKIILTEYYKKLAESGIPIATRLHPIVNSDKGVKSHPTYYLGMPTLAKPLNFMNAQHKVVKGEAMAHLMKTIRWMDTFQALLSELEDYVKYVEESGDRNLEKILDDNLKMIREVIFKNVHDVKVPLGYDDYVDKDVEKLHDEAEEAFQAYGEAYSQYEKNLHDFKKSKSPADKELIRASKAALKATKAAYAVKQRDYINKLRERGEIEQMSIDSFNDHQNDRVVKNTMKDMLNQVSGKGLRGRGLRGAGVAPLEGVVRRGRTYNLNDIKGLATPSAYTYRQLGSKYIRLPDLDAKTLVIVQPNRRKCGPKRQISDSLQSMIRNLVYKQHIDQSEYDKLTVDDKKLFKEILAITHLQYNFPDKLEDPLESLKAEYDKLKGELELGNDNPSIIKQLKVLTVDMYSNKLIGDKEFKEIITRLL